MNPALRSLLRAWLPLNLLNLLGVLVAMMFGPWVLVNLLGFSDASFGSLNLMRTFFVSYIGIAFFACNAAAWAPLSDLLSKTRLAPLSTRTIGLFLLLVPTLQATAINTVTIATYNALFDGSWPVAATSAWFTTTIFVAAAALSWIGTASGRAAGLAVTGFATWVFFIVWQFYPDGFDAPAVLWSHLTTVQSVCLAVTAFVSVAVFLNSYARYRCGASKADWLQKLADAEIGSQPDSISVNQTYNTPAASFRAMARKQIRTLTLGLQGGILLFGTIFCYVCLRTTSSPLNGLVATTPMFAAMAGIGIGVLMGMEVWLNRTGGLKTYIATLPVPDAVLGRLMLKSWIPLVLMAWVSFLLSALLAIILHALFEGSRDYVHHYRQLPMVQSLGPWSGLLWLLGTPLIAWTTAGLLGAIGLSGRQRLALWTVVLFFGLTTVIMWCWVFGGPIGYQVGRGLLLTIATIGSLTLTTWLIGTAGYRELISRQQILGCLSAATLVGVLAWLIIPGGIYWQAIGAGTAALVVAPVPAMPLALATNRHR